MVMLNGFSDLMEILVSLTGFGIIIGEMISLSVALVTGFWLFIKGGTSALTGFGIGSGVDFLTGSFAPSKTGGLIASMVKINAAAEEPEED